MTKSQSGKAFDTGAAANKTDQGNAQSSYTAATGDIGDYEKELATAGAANPFGAGGTYQTSQDQQLADTAAAGSQQAQQQAQAAAVRSGGNPASAIAAGADATVKNTQAEMGDVAAANQARIAQDAGYKSNILQASGLPAQLDSNLTATESGAATGNLNVENSAANTPSFWQELGEGVIQAGTSFAGGVGGGVGKKIG